MLLVEDDLLRVAGDPQRVRAFEWSTSAPPAAIAAGGAGRGAPSAARLAADTEVPSGWSNSSRSDVMPAGAGNAAVHRLHRRAGDVRTPSSERLPASSAVQWQASSFKSVNE